MSDPSERATRLAARVAEALLAGGFVSERLAGDAMFREAIERELLSMLLADEGDGGLVAREAERLGCAFAFLYRKSSEAPWAERLIRAEKVEAETVGGHDFGRGQYRAFRYDKMRAPRLAPLPLGEREEHDAASEARGADPASGTAGAEQPAVHQAVSGAGADGPAPPEPGGA